jgi:C1A family cysteine protease
MKTFIALTLAAAVSANSEVESAFMGYITQYGKSYGTIEEYKFRLEHFARNHATILEHNATDSTFQLGFNTMSDWSAEEYKARLTHKAMPEEDKVYEYHPEANATGIDWRSTGKVQAVKDQGQCGSCWAFSANSAMESSHAITSGKLYSFSEQQLVDCSTTSYGCNGGW